MAGANARGADVFSDADLGVCRRTGTSVGGLVAGLSNGPGGNHRFQMSSRIVDVFNVLKKPNAQEQDAPSSLAVERVPGDTVLLVDDQEDVRAVLAEGLEQHGYHVLEASDGAEALTLAERHTHHIAALVSDIVMPEMDGLELARRIRHTRPEIASVFISGCAAEEVERSCEAEGTFVRKPFQIETLVDRLCAAIDRQGGPPRDVTVV